MSLQGISQIVVYSIALIVLGYPLGLWMARVYTRERDDVVERGFIRLLGRRAGEEQDWKAYGKTVLVFSIAFSLVLYGLERLQGHLFLNPDGLPGVPAHISLNTAASFVTNTNWQYYGGEYTMSYLTQMAGLAVQNFVSAGVGMAVLAAVVRGISRRSTSGIGNFWRDLYRSIAYILLPLSVVLAVILISQGVVQTFHGHATATTLEGAQQTIARGPAASQIAIKQLGTNGGGFYNSNSAVPFENPNGITNFLEMLSILLIPGGAGVHVRADGARHGGTPGRCSRPCWPCSHRRRHRPSGRAARFAGAPRLGRQHHAGRRPERRQHVGQGGPVRHRQHRPLGGR